MDLEHVFFQVFPKQMGFREFYLELFVNQGSLIDPTIQLRVVL